MGALGRILYLLVGLTAAHSASADTNHSVDTLLSRLVDGTINAAQCRRGTDLAIRNERAQGRAPPAQAVYWWGRCSEALGARRHGAQAREWLAENAANTWWGWLAQSEIARRDKQAPRGSARSERAALVRAIIDVESAWDETAVSPKGAVGLMQVMPPTAAELLGKKGRGTDRDTQECLRNARCNARLGQHYLNLQLQRFNGSLLHALGAYHAGPSNSRWAQGVQRKRLNAGPWGADPALAIETWPIRETRAYLRRVLKRTAHRSSGAHGAIAALGHRRWPKELPLWAQTRTEKPRVQRTDRSPSSARIIVRRAQPTLRSRTTQGQEALRIARRGGGQAGTTGRNRETKP